MMSLLSAELMSSVISAKDGGCGRTFNADFFLNIVLRVLHGKSKHTLK